MPTSSAKPLPWLGIRHVFTRAHRPQTNGKVERFNRTLLEEWAYGLPYRSNERRTRLLDGGHTCTTTIDPRPR
jgi:transposase InsO family protein